MAYDQRQKLVNAGQTVVGQDNAGNYVRGDYHHFKRIGVKRNSDNTRRRKY
jgi:hypothetical protein